MQALPKVGAMIRLPRYPATGIALAVACDTFEILDIECRPPRDGTKETMGAALSPADVAAWGLYRARLDKLEEHHGARVMSRLAAGIYAVRRAA